MKIRAVFILSACILLTGLSYTGDRNQTAELQFEECTVGVAAGSATADGRPLLWKTRDSSAEDNEIYYNDSFPIKFVSVVSAGGTSSWMGVNEHGFAIINSLLTDLFTADSGPGNGSFMRDALGTCRTATEFEALLDSTNGARETRANFGVIDSTGAAAIYETSGYRYTKYDATDPGTAPDGWLVRTNFAMDPDTTGGGGYERYYRSQYLVAKFHAGDSLNHKSILRTQMRDFSDFDSQQVPVPFQDNWISGRPYGYIYTYVSICRVSSVSAAVIHGVKDGEPGRLSTLYAVLGQPASGIFVPYWPVGDTPSASNGSSTAPLCDIANDIRNEFLFDYAEKGNYIDSYKLRDEEGNGLWARTFPAEDSILTATAAHMAQWRGAPPSKAEMLAEETAIANYALSILDQGYDGLVTGIEDETHAAAPAEFALQPNYPNPFNASTTVRYSLPEPSHVELSVYNLLGQRIATLADDNVPAGSHTARWNAQNAASGVYFIRLTAGDRSFTQRCVLIK